MSGYSEIYCFDCQEQLGYASDCGPGPIYLCNLCIRNQDEGTESE